MDGNNVKKNDENGQLSCGIYGSPPAAGEPYIKVGLLLATAIARYSLAMPSLFSSHFRWNLGQQLLSRSLMMMIAPPTLLYAKSSQEGHSIRYSGSRTANAIGVTNHRDAFFFHRKTCYFRKSISKENMLRVEHLIRFKSLSTASWRVIKKTGSIYIQIYAYEILTANLSSFWIQCAILALKSLHTKY